MNNGRYDNNDTRRPGRRLALFLKAFGLTFGLALALLVAAAAALRLWVRPPDLPAINDMAQYAAADDGAAYLPAETTAEDARLGGGDRAPAGFTSGDRKELFFTFVVFGMDEGVNTDTIMVASYDGAAKEACLISIPRDTKVAVKRSVKKINGAYPAGTLNGGGKPGGVAQLKRELKTIVGFEPDFCVGVNLKAFTRIIDALGGVEVDVDMNMVYDDPAQDFHVNLSKGPQTLSGADALRYARYRMGNKNGPTPSITDYRRIEHQQAVIKAVLKKLLTPAALLKLPEFIDIFNENVYTDLEPENLLWFAEQMNALRGTDALRAYTAPVAGDDGSYVYLDAAAMVELVNETINPYAKAIEPKDVNIAGAGD